MPYAGKGDAMKIAVIGCGYWGPNLIRNFVQTNKVKELICCDLDQIKIIPDEKSLSHGLARG